MLHNRAIKMRIYPNDEKRYKIDVTLSHCRYIYNKMLERNTVIYKRRREHLNYYAMQNLLPEMNISRKEGDVIKAVGNSQKLRKTQKG